MIPSPTPDTPTEDPFPLTPNTPREQRLVHRFKETIAIHTADYFGEIESTTTAEFIDSLALDLWKLTRTHQ